MLGRSCCSSYAPTVASICGVRWRRWRRRAVSPAEHRISPRASWLQVAGRALQKFRARSRDFCSSGQRTAVKLRPQQQTEGLQSARPSPWYSPRAAEASFSDGVRLQQLVERSRCAAARATPGGESGSFGSMRLRESSRQRGSQHLAIAPSTEGFRWIRSADVSTTWSWLGWRSALRRTISTRFETTASTSVEVPLEVLRWLPEIARRTPRAGLSARAGEARSRPVNTA